MQVYHEIWLGVHHVDPLKMISSYHPRTPTYFDYRNIQDSHNVSYRMNDCGAELLGVGPSFLSSTGLRCMDIVGHDRHTMGLPLPLGVSGFKNFDGTQVPVTSSRFITRQS